MAASDYGFKVGANLPWMNFGQDIGGFEGTGFNANAAALDTRIATRTDGGTQGDLLRIWMFGFGRYC